MVPHCTLGMSLASEKVMKVIQIGSELPLLLEGHVTEIGVIEFRPVKHLFAFQLS
jgi:hypothetical protein